MTYPADPPRRSRHLLVPLLVAAANLPLFGCFAQSPTFTLDGWQVTEEGPDGTVVNFSFIGENPNDEALPLREVRYQLSLDGQRVFSGVRSAEATLPPNGAQRIDLPVALTLPDDAVVDPDARFRLTGSVTYVVPGAIAELFFDNNIRKPKTSITADGVLGGDPGRSEAAG
jgi:hypothetical protein